jgi:hypothetical protein
MMSNHPHHRSRRRRQIQVELLESRELLSASSASTTERYLLISPPSEIVSQQQSAFTVTLSLVKVQAAYRPEHFTVAGLNEPVTVDFSASLESTSDEPSTAANPIFTPFNESVTFPAGIMFETVTVPIVSTVVTPGPETISLSARTTSSSVLTSLPKVLQGGPDAVTLYSGPAPTITSVQLVTQGKLASAVVLGFNTPMAPASVENIHNYRILSRPATIHHSGSWSFNFTDGPGTFESTTTEYQSFPIAAATYDPSTSTATLTLKRPTKASRLYEISSAYPVSGHELTDPEGQPLAQANIDQGGNFTILVHATPLVTLPTVGALTSTWGGIQNWLSG